MRKSLVLLAFIIFFFPISKSAYAAVEIEGLHYSNGWFDANPGKFTAPSAVVDNDLGTGIKGKNFEITFNDEVDVKFVAFYMYCYQSNGAVGMEFYNASNQVIESYKCDNSFGTSTGSTRESYVMLSLNDKIKKIGFTMGKYSSAVLREFEIFDKVAVEKIKQLKVEQVTFNSARIAYELPNNAIGAKIYLNNVYVATVDKKNSSYDLTNLLSSSTYEVGVTAAYEKIESEIERISFKTEGLPALSNDSVQVSNITKDGAVVTIKTDKTYTSTVYLYDQEKVQKGQSSANGKNTFTLSNLNVDTQYKYFYRLKYKNGELSDYMEFEFKTALPDKEITNLKAIPNDYDVFLQWEMPKYSTLDHAVIYRKNDSAGIVAKAVSLFSSSDNYEPIFETNGTNFKDLTVIPDTQYTYKVTTVDSSNNETEGKMISVKTKKVTVGGGSIAKEENGDYVITWDNPKKGQMQVLIGGKEYKIVPASDQKIVIPGDKMKFDSIGKPDVKLVPIDEDGKPGIPSSPGGKEGGFGSIIGGAPAAGVLNAPNLLKAGVALLGVVGSFILLGLAFKLVPKLIHMIRTAYKGKVSKETQVGRRSET